MHFAFRLATILLVYTAIKPEPNTDLLKEQDHLFPPVL